jgi:hypothetical protein
MYSLDQNLLENLNRRMMMDLDGDGVEDRREGMQILYVLITYAVCLGAAVAFSVYVVPTL